MKRIELCRMCTEYSTDTRCEVDNCSLQEILTENAVLKNENATLRDKVKLLEHKISSLEEERSWEKFPEQMGR